MPSTAVANLTQEQYNDLVDVFKVFDRDGTGDICPTELQVAMNSLGLKPTLDEVKQMILEIDVDGDGRINFEEFLEIMAEPARPVGESKNELVAAFEVFDKDGSGSVSPSELRSVLISLGQRHSDEEIDEMVRQADLDRNGSIDYHEFVQLMDPKK
ncbi:calmodulin [Sodiomyces alkalinus F11]|uniref:Calmodulin n=1 Tax=Sodiomyces alkalinus (strain CBS 110278 / VKM F-3762 / F11) TaxID=1314773 RepID=A0A3N2PR03_SODAK|nr:calmodulin [Sodiomyces alkalinus F11]ROT36915.1 calmodulin [Sodiomyces alkalinus F11]